MTKEKAHKYLTDKGCLSISQTYTAFQVERMLVEFADQETEMLKAELNELKEKHKRDVESAFRDGLYRPKLYMNNAELYYKQKFESND